MTRVSFPGICIVRVHGLVSCFVAWSTRPTQQLPSLFLGTMYNDRSISPKQTSQELVPMHTLLHYYPIHRPIAHSPSHSQSFTLATSTLQATSPHTPSIHHKHARSCLRSQDPCAETRSAVQRNKILLDTRKQVK